MHIVLHHPVMAARALSSATIAFGMVSIPVKLFSSSESSQDIRFNQIDESDGSRLKQQMINANTGKPVSRDQIVKGYEFSKGQYVLFNPEELKAVESRSTQTIDITEFIPADQVARIYMDKTYYLAPDKGGARAYRLLNQALLETGQAAIAKYAARGKQYLVMVRPEAQGLAMEQLKYNSEIRPFSEIPVEEAEVNQAELDLAVQLVNQASSEVFRPENYRDEIRERMLELIQQKVDGQEITVSPSEDSDNKIIDMMAALKASLDQGGATKTGKRKPAKRAVSKKAPRKTTAKTKKG